MHVLQTGHYSNVIYIFFKFKLQQQNCFLTSFTSSISVIIKNDFFQTRNTNYKVCFYRSAHIRTCLHRAALWKAKDIETKRQTTKGTPLYPAAKELFCVKFESASLIAIVIVSPTKCQKMTSSTPSRAINNYNQKHDTYICYFAIYFFF